MKRSKKLFAVLLALTLVFGLSVSAFAAPPQNDGLTTDEWIAGPIPVFDVTVASWQVQEVELRAVPTETGFDTPSGFLDEEDAEDVVWSFVGYSGSATIGTVAAVAAENYNAPIGSYASQVFVTIPHGHAEEEIEVKAELGSDYVHFVIDVRDNTFGRYLEGNALPPDPNNPVCSTYLVEEPDVADEITVTLIVTAGDEIWEGDGAFRVETPQVLSGSTNGLYTVTDLLYAVDGTNDLIFNDGNFTPTTNFLTSVEHDDIVWEYGQLAFDGWVFRVNDLFPVQLTSDGLGYEGTSILQTYLEDGDVIYFFYDFPSDFSPTSGNLAANYVRGAFDSFDSGTNTLTVNLQEHLTRIHPTSYIFNVYNYTPLVGVSASLYESDGTTLVGTDTSGAGGVLTFSGVTPGEYILKTTPVLYSGSVSFVHDVYFERTGAYSKITVL